MTEPLITLVATLHDPDSRLASLAAPFIEDWLTRFREVVILTSPQGGGKTGEMLTAHGARVIADPRPQGLERLGLVRLWALQAAAEGDHPYYLKMDFDRVIHWEANYPDELRRIEQLIPEYDFLVLGRTQRAFESHPYVQRETERLANAAFAHIFGQPYDITSGQRALSAAAVAHLSDYSRCHTLGVDAEWPILCHRAGLRVGQLDSEGLEYETADCYADIIHQIGYQNWLEQYINTPQSWQKRLRLTYQMALATRDACEREL